MKKLILTIIIAFAFVAMANAQRVYSVTADTLQGAETVTFSNITSTASSGSLSLQAVCTELGGTSDGTLIVQGSVDGLSFVDLVETTGVYSFYPNDTLTITDGAVMILSISNSPLKYYRFKGVGTTGDTTLVQPKFLPKLK